MILLATLDSAIDAAPKPVAQMKRNVHIIPLSRDHHHGLLFCWKIRQGINRNASPERVQSYVDYFWKQHLLQHFHDEEKILFLDRKNALCQTAIAEHRQIEELVRKLSSSKPDKAQLLRLADLIHDHIRFEERELFPWLESELSIAELAEIGGKLQESHSANKGDSFCDEFWI